MVIRPADIKASKSPFDRKVGKYQAVSAVTSLFISRGLLLDFAMITPTSEMVDNVVDLPTDPPCLYFDIQGVNFPTWPPFRWQFDNEEANFSNEDSSVSLSQLLVKPRNHIYLIDVNGPWSLWSSALMMIGARETGASKASFRVPQSSPKSVLTSVKALALSSRMSILRLTAFRTFS